MHSLEHLGVIAAVFVVAGWVKGVVGMGLPTVAMGVLGLLMPPVQAAALLVVPALVTNLWQIGSGSGGWRALAPLVRRFWSLLVGAVLGTVLGIQFLTSGHNQLPSLALGAALVLYALLALALPKLAVAQRLERIASPLVGTATGVLSGATGVWVIPAVPYLSALALNKDELIQALGMSFTVSSIALTIGLGANSSLPLPVLLASVATLAPALAGMWLGQLVRDRIDPNTFKRWFFMAMLGLGLSMMAKALAT